MLHHRSRIILFVVFLFGVFLLRTELTSADLVATRSVVGNVFGMSTLQLSAILPYKSDKIIGLFDLAGMERGGFEVRGFRIKKDGKLNFKYNLSSSLVSGEQTLCSQMQIMASINGQAQYSGSAIGINLNRDISTNGTDDWIFILKSPTSLGEEWKGKGCAFKILVKTYRYHPGEEKKGFWSERELISNLSIQN